MIIEQHYDDEVLIGLLNEAEEDSHVPACDTCAGTLESYRDLSSALHDGVVWDEREVSEAPSPKTTNFLRDFAARSKAEDVAARPIVAKLIADPASIEQHPEWRTAGVVRGLLAYVDTINLSDPQLALNLARVAVVVADSLDDIQSARLKASAWHELGYALYVADQYVESLAAYDQADELYRATGIFEFESANVALHRAQVYGDLERIDEALAIIRRTREVFRRYAASKREAAADATEATLLWRVRRFSEALAIHQRIAADERTTDAGAKAFAHYNSAVCLMELSRIKEAKREFAVAISEFDRMQAVSMRTRARWLFGRILLAENSYDQALASFALAQTEFAELGLHHEVARIAVDTAETLWVMGRVSEVAQHCHSAMEYFGKAGLAYTKGALTALAYLKEAAETGTLTRTDVGKVRDFFEILPKQPHLLFAFPA